MRRVACSLVLTVVFGLAGKAAADTFNLSGTLASGGSASGTASIDTGTGFVNSINVTVVADGGSFLFTGAPFVQNHTGPLPSPIDAYFLYVTQNTVTNTALNLCFRAQLRLREERCVP